MCMSKVCNNRNAGSDGEENSREEDTKVNCIALGRIIRKVLTQARNQDRLICGLLPAIAYLEKTVEETVICLLAESRPGDATAHLQTVLLQAFCYENYIPVIKVDSSEKLAELCGTSVPATKSSVGCQCAIITRDLTIPWNDDNFNPPLTDVEQTLADFYEETLEESPSPVVKLPR